MVKFEKFQLENGLRVVFHQDVNTPMAAVSVIYDVGSKDEAADKTGYTHLFEHLMFSGSKNAEDFDEIIQDAGGENNAYTNSDLTHFYNILPKSNIRTALFLEADRMENLLISEEAFETQRKVVLEEFLETCQNQPYGDTWHHLLGMVYKKHPYRWPTIGLVPAHIEQAERTEVIKFYTSHYHPGNAVLSIGGNFELEEIKALVQYYFGNIEATQPVQRPLVAEPEQEAYQRLKVVNDVPNDTLYMAFHMAGRMDQAYYVQDLLSDILANGASTRLISKLVHEEQVFGSIDAYVYGSTEPGLFIIEGQPMDDVSMEEAERRVWEELALLCDHAVTKEEMEKQQNKVRTNLIMSETSLLGKVMSLGYYELLGDIDLINNEEEIYAAVTIEDLQQEAQRLFQRSNCSVLEYLAEGS